MPRSLQLGAPDVMHPDESGESSSTVLVLQPGGVCLADQIAARHTRHRGSDHAQLVHPGCLPSPGSANPTQPGSFWE
jgi:hypothetical protein